MSRQNTAIRKIEQAIDAIDETIHQQPTEIMSITNIAQLEHFKARLSKALTQIREDRIPERNYRDLGIAKLIADQWPYNLVLGITIIEAEQAYKAL